MKTLFWIFCALALFLTGCSETNLDSELTSITISFNTMGGNLIEDVVIERLDDAIHFETPIKEGYLFDGWYIDSDYEHQFELEDMMLAELTLYAKWHIQSYELQFVDDEDRIIETIFMDYNSDLDAVIIPDAPSKEGYTFSDWDQTLPDKMPASNLKIQAQYVINTYTLTFLDVDSEIIISYDMQYQSDLSGISLPNPALVDGYQFSHWDLELPDLMPASDLSIQAMYRIKSYMLYFLDKDDEMIVSYEFDYMSTLSESLLPLAPDILGYEFISWDQALPEKMPAHDVYMRALYETITYNLLFMDNLDNIIASYTFAAGSDLSGVHYPTVPELEGYTYLSWMRPLPSLMPASDLIIRAYYEINTYQLSFTDGKNIIETYVITYHSLLSDITIPEPFDKLGQTFIGWDQVLPEKMPASDLEIIAMYEKNTYTISFYNEDDKLISSIDLLYTDPFETSMIPLAPDKEGHTFMGWDKLFPTIMPALNIDYKPVYQKNTYILSFYDESQNLIASYEILFETDLTDFVIPIAPEVEGHTLSGWDIELPHMMPAEDVTLQAVYTINSYTLTFINDQDEVIETYTLAYGSDLSSIPIHELPERDYHYFNGWSEEIPNTMPAFDMILEAQYMIVERKIVGSDTLVGDQFGSNVKIHGDYMIVLSYAYQDFQGAIYVYKLSDPSYERIITGTGTDSNDLFGGNISIIEDYLLVSARNYDNFRGALFIYKFSDESYERKLVGHASDDAFASSYIVHEDHIIIGANGYNNDQGAVYIYKLSDPLYERVLIGASTDQGDRFGYNFNVYNNYLIVNAPVYDSSKGAVFIYHLLDESFNRMLVGELSSSQFGNDSIVHGNYILISAPSFNLSEGAIYIYKLDDIEYERRIRGSETNSYDYFGSMMDVKDDFLITSADGYNDAQGALFIYKLSDELYERKIIGQDTLKYDYFGLFQMKDDYIIVNSRLYHDSLGAIFVYHLYDESYAKRFVGEHANDGFAGHVKIEHNIIMTSAYCHNESRGALYVYQLRTDSMRKITGNDSEVNDKFGIRYAISGDYVVVQASNDDLRKGSLYVYKLSDLSYERKIVASDGVENDELGVIILIQNDILIATTRTYVNMTGKVYVYGLEPDTIINQ